MVWMPCDHHPITSQLGLTYNTLLKALRGLKMGGWRIWWIYNRLLYWFRFGFGKVIRVWWHSFNSSDSFPIGFSKIFQISVRSFDIIHLMSDENFYFRTDGGIRSHCWRLANLILKEILGKRLWNNLQSAGNAFPPLILLMMWLHDFDCINHDYGPVSSSFISSFINKPTCFINKPTLK